jgi:transcriptional regulator with XRE-family HTH domain
MARAKSRDIRDVHPIRAYRMRRGIVMAELAARAGITKAALSFIENHRTRLPTLAVISRLVAACDGEVTACEIFQTHFDAAGTSL